MVQTYDDYPVISAMQFADLGFCAPQELPAFLAAHDFTVAGDLPHNTSGGQLSLGQAGCAGGHLGLVESDPATLGHCGGPAGKRGKAGAGVGVRDDQFDRGLGSGRRRAGGRVMRVKKNPLHRTRRPLLPPGQRSRTAHLLTAAAAEGRFALPCCTACGRFAWPMPEACPACLGDMALAPAMPGARVLSATTAEVPADAYFRERSPWRVGLVQMDCGPQALVHLSPGAGMGDAVRLALMLDRAGNAVLHAGKKGEDMATDPQWHEMVADPRDRRILITDARHIAALPLAQALARAGAVAIFAGVPDPWKPLDTRAALEAVPGLELVALDVTSDRSVSDLAAQIGGKVEILINTADLPRPGGLMGPTATVEARAAMETVAFGLMRLARAFGPALAGRGADGGVGAVAWVNLLSVFAHAAPPAGRLCRRPCRRAGVQPRLRADLAMGGVRLLTAFAGPTDDPWFQSFPQPKVTGKALADGILAALLKGQEEAVIGDLARDLMERLRENPKAVERDLAQGRM
jgi:uncharacterized OB-fold protein